VPATFRILPERGLVYVQYTGFVRIDETRQLIATYLKHPDRHPGQKQLVDLSGVTGFEQDFVRLMALQAAKAAIFSPDARTQTLMVYFAPTEVSYAMARLILRSWNGVTHVIATAQRHEAEALDILGQPERRLEDLLSAAR